MPTKGLWSVGLVVTVIALSGCQTWPGGGFPMQNTTRVPPPGTGTYQLPNGYYNNTSGLPTGSSGMQTSQTGGLRPATGAYPTTQLAASPSATSVSNANYSSQPASPRGAPAGSQSFTAPANNSRVTTATYSESSEPDTAAAGAPASARLSDDEGPEPPSLQWQQ